MTRDARLPALHRGDFGLRSRASFSGICSGSVQRAPRGQVIVPGGRGPVPPQTAVVSRHRGTPRLAPPSGSPPEMPLDERSWNLCIMALFCSQAQNVRIFQPQFELNEPNDLTLGPLVRLSGGVLAVAQPLFGTPRQLVVVIGDPEHPTF